MVHVSDFRRRKAYQQTQELHLLAAPALAGAALPRRGNTSTKPARQPLRSFFLRSKYQWNIDSTLYFASEVVRINQGRLRPQKNKTLAQKPNRDLGAQQGANRVRGIGAPPARVLF